jgi:hypothetical protein
MAELHAAEPKRRAKAQAAAAHSHTMPRIYAAEAKFPELDSKRKESAPRRRILIIEDNDEARDSIHAFLAEAGHEIYEAIDGPTGVKKALEV